MEEKFSQDDRTMAENGESSAKPGIAAEGLRSKKTAQRLELISRLRARGVGNHVALPQLVVCGDQSAGKSSVLEGLTQIPFPQQEGLCTTFATEIILQHRSGEMSVRSSIIPSQTRSPDEAARLNKYHDEQPIERLPEIIAEAGDQMGIREPGMFGSGPAFVEDVLRIEIHGPHGIHLSVVDLPGLISVPNEDQTNDDVDTVHRLVEKYVQDRRTIILAVVQAGNDIANQPIIRKSKTFDTKGERTVGIITKPDLINTGAENRIALLASNKDTTKLKLGFFLVKNPSPGEKSKGLTYEKRFKNEKQYFQSPPWSEQALKPERTGTPALRTYLQVLLEEHIEKELPRVRDEIKICLQGTENELAETGIERSDPAQMRIYLTRLAMSFHKILTSATNGTYDDTSAKFFAGPEHQQRRLRAVIQNMNSRYADEMREHGRKRCLVTDPNGGDNADDDDKYEKSSCQKVSAEGMKKWIRSVYEHSRGKELAGTYGYVLLGELFHEQSSPWYEITIKHMEKTHEVIEDFVISAIAHTVTDQQTRRALGALIGQQLDTNRSAAHKEFENLWTDEQHQPITYNHYFTDNIQKGRRGNGEELVRKTVEEAKKGGTWQFTADRIIDTMRQSVNIDMNDQACHEAMNGLEAYYKVTRKTFVDNVCKQIIERHMIRKLSNLFSPDLVAEMDDAELERIAGESAELTEKRRELRKLKEELSASLKELREFRHH